MVYSEHCAQCGLHYSFFALCCLILLSKVKEFLVCWYFTMISETYVTQLGGVRVTSFWGFVWGKCPLSFCGEFQRGEGAGFVLEECLGNCLGWGDHTFVG